MSFKCQKCGRISHTGETAVHVITKTRPRIYPSVRPGGEPTEGFEIVRELQTCQKCGTGNPFCPPEPARFEPGKQYRIRSTLGEYSKVPIVEVDRKVVKVMVRWALWQKNGSYEMREKTESVAIGAILSASEVL